MPVKGLNKVNNRLKDLAETKIPRLVEKGVHSALHTGLGYSILITPKDTSLLVNSSFVETRSDSRGAYGEVGYTASYAGAVHNIKNPKAPTPRASGNGLTWDPEGEPFFLTNAFEQNMNDINQVFYKAIKL